MTALGAKKTAGTHPRRLAAGCVPVSMIPFILFGSLPEAPFFWRGGLTKRALPLVFSFGMFSIPYAGGLVKGEEEKNGENRIEKGTRAFRTFDASA